MTFKQIPEILKEHPFFKDLNEDYIRLIADCGRNQIIAPGNLILEEGKPADHFYLIRQGKVAVEIHVPHRGAVQLQTLQAGDILGWSWLFPPYKWSLDASAIDTVHAIAMNAKCLREKCDKDTVLGYTLMKTFSQIMAERLQSTLLQLLDVYDNPSQSRRLKSADK